MMFKYYKFLKNSKVIFFQIGFLASVYDKKTVAHTDTKY